jgi:hypothetical protein
MMLPQVAAVVMLDRTSPSSAIEDLPSAAVGVAPLSARGHVSGSG